MIVADKMSYPNPPDSRSAVKKAGKAIANGTSTNADIEIVDQWRASHGYVINTFQAWIKGHISKRSVNVEFAQRLKRRRTVEDKLKRKDSFGKPLISDVTSMHDFAGCRMIFENIDELTKFRDYMQSIEVTRNIEHELRHQKDKYDYIESPKYSGYRGIHDVYRHYPRGHRRLKETPRPWDGLMVEIQYRTRAQHAWATAVEISDILDGERTKFDINETERGQFFSFASEIIARRYESKQKSFLDINTDKLQEYLQILEDKLGIMQRLQALKQFEDENKLQNHNVLNIIKNQNGEIKLEVFPFSSASLAIEKATLLENDENSLNAVYVRSDNPKQLRSAYRNYFYDPVDFVKLLQSEANLT
jgi:putative GTP pyrophosphokinase